MSESEVLADLRAMDGNKARLMQKYSDEQRVILNRHGGNLSDLPMEKDSPYHRLQDKINILGKM